LTLPDGATLRSYLADKLNCDPMRITKKYAGASCLGRRTYQFRDRAHPTVAEIQIAKAELDHLEQRFRNRIEGGGLMSPEPSATSDGIQSPFVQQQQQPGGELGNPMALASNHVGHAQALNVLQTLLATLAGPPAASNISNQNGSTAPTDAHFGFSGLSLPQAPAAPLPVLSTPGFPPGFPLALAQLLMPNIAVETPA
jgi:hypothetical protein